MPNQPENVYENFRTLLTMNLSKVLESEKLSEVLKAIDITLNDFEICKKSMDLIVNTGLPEAAKVYIASKAVENLSRKTLTQYTYKLTNFFEAVCKSYADVTTNDIRMYLYRYKTEHNVSDRYMESIRITLNGFFAWMVENDYLERNPCAKIEKIRFQPKKREPLTPYELELIRHKTKDIREKALIDFFFSTGVRVSECSDTNISDIDWHKRSVLIRHGKGDKERTVFFNAEAEVSLRAYLESRTDNEDALFVNVRSPHQRLKPHALEIAISKIAKRAGLHVFPHKLRHTFATSGLRGGMPLEKLQKLMGHEKPDTTLIYAKIDQQDLQMEHQRVYT